MSNGNHNTTTSSAWCKTADGQEINLFDLDASLFTVGRIAHALARINRFAGHWVLPVSVARHSIHVANQLCRSGYDIETQLQGLFHDAAEAFTTDIPSPLKRLLYVRPPREQCREGDGLTTYGMFEEGVLRQIFNALEIEYPVRSEVHAVDKCTTIQEFGWVWGGDTKLYGSRSTDPDVVAVSFKSLADTLFDERAHANDIPTGARK